MRLASRCQREPGFDSRCSSDVRLRGEHFPFVTPPRAGTVFACAQHRRTLSLLADAFARHARLPSGRGVLVTSHLVPAVLVVVRGVSIGVAVGLPGLSRPGGTPGTPVLASRVTEEVSGAANFLSPRTSCERAWGGWLVMLADS